MRVLSIGQLPTEVGGNYTSGIARVVYELSRESSPGIEKFLYATNISDKRAKVLCKKNNEYMGYVVDPLSFFWSLIRNPIKTVREWGFYKNKCYEKPIHMAFFKWNFERVLKMVHPEIIHLHGAGLAPLYFARGSSSIPILMTYHGIMWDGEESRFETIYKSTYKFADLNTGLNNECIRKMLKIGIDRNKIMVVPNGVDANKYYYSHEEREKLRAEFNVSEATPVFVTVGYVVERKGQLSFLKILEELGIDYQYWIIGKGPDCQSIIDYSANSGIQNRVKLLGYKKDSELYKYLSAADIYAHASTTEGQALSETEAYATGLRIIVNSLISDTVAGNSRDDKESYYICDFCNVNKNELLKWLNANNNRSSRKNLDWSIIAQEYAKVYSKLYESQK